jgi:hypothetical protein
MNIAIISFNIFEFILFILPALPNQLLVRLSILLLYFISHYFKIQNLYSKFKYKFVNKNE